MDNVPGSAENEYALNNSRKALDFSVTIAVLSSAGFPDCHTEKKATMDATRSKPECAASAMTLTECIMSPTTSFATVRTVFDNIDNAAALIFSRPVDIL